MNAVTEVMDELRKALAELEDCRARNADLRTMLEQVTRERDEARAEVERWRTSYEAASSHAVDVRAMLDQVRKELYEARCEVNRLMHQLADATNETTRARLQAKREIEALTDERDELLVRVANADAELRATREAYVGAKWTNAYRRGAEVMREACEAAIHAAPEGAFAERVIRALPIPEEP